MGDTKRWLMAIIVLMPGTALAATAGDGPVESGRIEGVASGQGVDVGQRWHVAAWQCRPMLVRHAQRNLDALRLTAERDVAVGGGVTVRVAAASPMLRPFVPATLLRFSVEGALLAVSGRLLPHLGTARAPRPVDGELRVRGVQLAGGCSRPAEAA